MLTDPDRYGRLKALLIGGVVGASAALAATRRRRPPPPVRRPRPVGLAAFEDAPCYREALEGDRSPR